MKKMIADSPCEEKVQQRCRDCKFWKRYQAYSRNGQCSAPIPHGVPLYFRDILEKDWPLRPIKSKDGTECPSFVRKDGGR